MTASAIYVRISDDREGAGLGVERQENDCRALAAALGWDVAEVYVDNDLTAYAASRRSKPRPAYQRMLSALSEGIVTGIVVWHNDRLHRSARELEDFIDLIDRVGAAVQTVKAGRYDLTTPTGRMQARIVGAVAQYESEHKSERVKAKYRQLAEAGEVGNGGHRPFGYAADRRSVIPEEAEALRDAYAQVRAGRSLRSVANDLSNRGFLTTTGRPWSMQALRYNLLSGRNAGLREHKGVVVGPAVWPAVVDRATWDDVRAVLLDKRRHSGDHDGARRYLLTGFLRCGLCGSKLRTNRQASEQRFACRRDNGGCGGILIRYAPVEDFIVDLVLDRLEAEAHLNESGSEAHDPAAELHAEIAREELRLERLVAAYADDPEGDPLELRAASRKHRERISDLKETLADSLRRQPLREDPAEVRAAWLVGKYDLEQKRGVVDLLIERIDVASAIKGRNYVDPGRLSVTWR